MSSKKKKKEKRKKDVTSGGPTAPQTSTKKGKPINYESHFMTHQTLPYLLDDLLSRFVLNAPKEELASFDRICFQMELAHWFYIDFYREADPSLPKYNIRSFITALFHRCSLLQPFKNDVDKILLNWVTYKISVPVYGVIILNSKLDKVLLVKGFNKGSTWGFPKGKVNKDELGIDCAVREAWEETSLDVIGFVNEKDSIVVDFQLQRQQLFIVSDVDERTKFKPQTRGEISSTEWHNLTDIPRTYKEGKQGAQNRSSKYFTVVPFMRKLLVWIKNKKTERSKKKKVVKIAKATVRQNRLDSRIEAELLHHFSPLSSSFSEGEGLLPPQSGTLSLSSSKAITILRQPEPPTPSHPFHSFVFNTPLSLELSSIPPPETTSLTEDLSHTLAQTLLSFFTLSQQLAKGERYAKSGAAEEEKQKPKPVLPPFETLFSQPHPWSQVRLKISM